MVVFSPNRSYRFLILLNNVSGGFWDQVERKYEVELRDFQKDCVLCCLNGRDCLVNVPAGSGKTFCKQIVKYLGGIGSHSLIADWLRIVWRNIPKSTY